MHPTTLLLALGLTLTATTNAAPLSAPAPTAGPIFTPICCRVNASTATGAPNATAGESPPPHYHSHTPDCRHDANATSPRAYNSSAAQAASPSAAFNASSAYAHHRHHAAAGVAHNHTGADCAHPTHRNTTAPTHHHQLPLHNATAPPTHHNHTDHDCADASHRNGTTTTDRYGEKAATCLGTECPATRAEVDSAGVVATGGVAKRGKRGGTISGTGMAYVDVAREMSGAGIAGGV